MTYVVYIGAWGYLAEQTAHVTGRMKTGHIARADRFTWKEAKRAALMHPQGFMAQIIQLPERAGG